MPTPQLRAYPGYFGHHTQEQADDAIPNGTKILKTNTESGDSFADGTPGVILGSFEEDGVYMYFIEWEPQPGVAIMIAEHRIRRPE